MPRRKGSRKVGGKSALKEVGESNQEVKNVYRDMLAEVESSPAQTGDDGRATKKRRIRGQIVTQDENTDRDGNSPSVSRRDSLFDSDTDAAGAKSEVQPIREQITYRDESDDSDESDFDWEEVEVANDLDLAENSQSDKEENRNLDLTLEPDGIEGRRRSKINRRPVTAAERKLRLEIHKTHLLCLLFHVHLRNHWCNDEQLHVSETDGKMYILNC